MNAASKCRSAAGLDVGDAPFVPNWPPPNCTKANPPADRDSMAAVRRSADHPVEAIAVVAIARNAPGQEATTYAGGRADVHLLSGLCVSDRPGSCSYLHEAVDQTRGQIRIGQAQTRSPFPENACHSY